MADRNRGDRYGGEYRSSRGPSRFSDGPVNHHNRRSPKAYRTTGFSDRLPGVDGHRRLFDSPPRHSPAEGGGGFQPMAPPQGGFNSDYQVPLSGQKRGFPLPSRGGGSPDAYDGGSFAKLFVGSVPRTAAEEDIRPLFEEHGQVIEVALIKDKRTGQQQGCCFIKYATSEEAERAIRALHNQHILPGGVGPIQVRYADGERERLGTVEYKLFVGSLNRQATEKEVEEIFSPYGRVEDVYLMRDDMKQSRGCGFVKFSHRDMAMAAINALNGIYTMRGCEQPLIVRFADPKRPRPGESRGNPAFGGPGFSPRFQAPGIRPTPNIADPMSGRMPSGAWHPMGPQDMSPSSTATSQGFGSQLIPSTLGAPPGGSFDGSFPGRAISSNFKSQQDFNHSLPQNPSGSLQISPLQKSFPSPNFSSSLQLHSQAPVSYSQTQATNTALGQTGQLPSLHSAGQASFNPAVSSHQIIGSGTQLSVSQCQVPQSTPSATPLQTQSSSGQQQLLQPLQQPPSQLAQLLSQQTQNLQASFQSSQQAFTQLQQQLQLMQPSNQSALPQQKPQATKQQSQWPGVSPHSVSSTPAITAVADVPLTTSAAPAATMIAQTVASVNCNWTEHTSPDGYKYYYNSVTGESKWEKPEELTIYEQQQQKQSVQRLPTQLHPLVLSTQQLPQNQQAQLQAQLQHQQQLQQAQLSSSETGYSQFQGSTTSVNDPSRIQQGLQATQEWMWKNKPAA